MKSGNHRSPVDGGLKKSFTGIKGLDDVTGGGLPQGRPTLAGQTPRSVTALANLKAFCEQHVKGKYCIEVVDLLRNPQLASGDQILAIPTLVRKLPQPVRKIIGDLSNTERVLVGLDLRPAEAKV